LDAFAVPCYKELFQNILKSALIIHAILNCVNRTAKNYFLYDWPSGLNPDQMLTRQTFGHYKSSFGLVKAVISCK
jgi:hypothetical protein